MKTFLRAVLALAASLGLTLATAQPPTGNNQSGGGGVAQSGTITTNDCVKWASATSITDAGAPCGAGGSTFTALTSGTNTTAAMLVGTGATLGPTGSGTLTATSLNAYTGLPTIDRKSVV